MRPLPSPLRDGCRPVKHVAALSAKFVLADFHSQSHIDPASPASCSSRLHADILRTWRDIKSLGTNFSAIGSRVHCPQRHHIGISEDSTKLKRCEQIKPVWRSARNGNHSVLEGVGLTNCKSSKFCASSLSRMTTMIYILVQVCSRTRGGKC